MERCRREPCERAAARTTYGDFPRPSARGVECRRHDARRSMALNALAIWLCFSVGRQQMPRAHAVGAHGVAGASARRSTAFGAGRRSTTSARSRAYPACSSGVGCGRGGPESLEVTLLDKPFDTCTGSASAAATRRTGASVARAGCSKGQRRRDRGAASRRATGCGSRWRRGRSPRRSWRAQRMQKCIICAIA